MPVNKSTFPDGVRAERALLDAIRDRQDLKSYGLNVDFIRYNIVDDAPVAAAVFELTHFSISAAGCKPKLLERMQRHQGRLLRTIAAALDVKPWLVLFSVELNEFHIYNLANDDDRWWEMDQEKFMQWVESL